MSNIVFNSVLFLNLNVGSSVKIISWTWMLFSKITYDDVAAEPVVSISVVPVGVARDLLFATPENVYSAEFK